MSFLTDTKVILTFLRDRGDIAIGTVGLFWSKGYHLSVKSVASGRSSFTDTDKRFPTIPLLVTWRGFVTSIVHSLPLESDTCPMTQIDPLFNSCLAHPLMDLMTKTPIIYPHAINMMYQSINNCHCVIGTKALWILSNMS